MNGNNEDVEGEIETSEDTLVPAGKSLIDALDDLGLVMKPSDFSLGKKLAIGACAITGVGLLRIFRKLSLVPAGCIGLSLNNGVPVFLCPGRHFLLSFTHNFVRNENINAEQIQHGPITIVTIKKGELGLSWRNGHMIILEQGRHILVSPHVFSSVKKISDQYIEMGPFKRILIHQGQVGIAYDTGKLEVLPAGLHIRTSPTYTFAEVVSVQEQVKRLDPLVVNTNDGIAIMVNAIITYRIDDPAKAFKDVQKVNQALFDRAEATLTSIFLHHSIDEIAPTLPGAKNEVLSTPGGGSGLNDDEDMSADESKDTKHHHHKGKKKVNFVSPLLFSDIVREAFMDQLRDYVMSWGIVLLDMSIEKLEFHDVELKKLLAQRASNKLQTASDRANIAAQAATGIQKAEGLAQEQKIKADAELYTAEQRAKGGRLQEDSVLARELAILRGMREVVEAAGNKTTFIPWNMKLDLRDGGAGYWLQDSNQETLPLAKKSH